MKRPGKTLVGTGILFAAALGAVFTFNSPAHAQNGYMIGENGATADSGPVRLARFAYISGPVTWRPASTGEWSRASNNLPLRQGAQVWVKGGSRSELQFDDGSTLRLGGGAVCDLQTLYSDDRGEYTEIKLNDGLATLHLRNKLSKYQIDTPLTSVKCSGPAEIRVGVGNAVEVACLAGDADIEGRQGQTVLHTRQRLDIPNDRDPYRVTDMPAPDNWDRFNDNRDVIYSHHNLHVPQNIDLVAGDLDNYGTWHDDPSYGYVWAPRVHERGWRPYHHGHWVWVSPWGWTWVGDEDWGWAPYHYGTWVDEPYGWAWVPGPAVQYWSPAVVDWADDDDYVGWVPLAPREVVYPSALNIGFHSGNWWLNFSIGGAAAFFPAGPGYCAPRPWANEFSNREVNIYNVTNIYNNAYYGSNNYFARNSRFIPMNATRFGGMTMASRNAFLNGGRFAAPQADPRGAFFHRGRSFASQPGRWQISGPPTIRPTAMAFTPSRHFARAGGPPQNMLQRSVVRGPLPGAIASHRPGMQRAFAPANRPAPIARQGQPANRFNAMSRNRFTGALHARPNGNAGQLNRHFPQPNNHSMPPVRNNHGVGQLPRHGGSPVVPPHRNFSQPQRHFVPHQPTGPTHNQGPIHSRPQFTPRQHVSPRPNFVPHQQHQGPIHNQPQFTPRQHVAPSQFTPRQQPHFVPHQQPHFVPRQPGPRPGPQARPSRPPRQGPPPQRGGGGGGDQKKHHGGG